MAEPFVMPNGKHVGELITRIPLSYLRWMVQAEHTYAAQAKAELDRRGTDVPAMDVSAHAVDRASLRLLGVWERTRGPDEGLHTWLARMAADALQQGHKGGDGKIFHAGCTWVFGESGAYPVLMSCWKNKDRTDQPTIEDVWPEGVSLLDDTPPWSTD